MQQREQSQEPVSLAQAGHKPTKEEAAPPSCKRWPTIMEFLHQQGSTPEHALSKAWHSK